MDRAEAVRRLDALIARNGGTGPALVGILIAIEGGDIALSMDSADDLDIRMMGVRAHRRDGAVVVDAPVREVTPTLERP